jgi:hypothetical protein
MGTSPSQGRYVHTEQQKENKYTETSMPLVGFEPTIPLFQRANTVHALDRVATVIETETNYTHLIDIIQIITLLKMLVLCSIWNGWYFILNC